MEIETKRETKSFTIKNKLIEVEYDPVEDTFYLPILYKKNKNGKISYWKVSIQDGCYTVRTGLMEGKERVFEKIVSEGKGKSSVLEQSIFNAKSEWNKKIDGKYVIDLDGVGNCDSLTTLRPMKAQNFDKHSKKIKEPFAISPKLDGIRALIFIDKKPRKEEGHPDGEDEKETDKKEVIILSKLGKEYKFMDKIRKEAKKLIKRIKKRLVAKYGKKKYKIVLDGELYIHGQIFDYIQSIVTSKKTRSEEEDKLEYWIFDLYIPTIPDMIYTDRVELLESSISDLKRMKLVSFEKCNDKNLVEEKLEEFSKTYEGIMIRNLDSVYTPDYRSFDLQKSKKFYDKEFKIVDTTEGEGTHAGCIIYVCQLPDEKTTFTVSPKQDLDTRKKLANDQEYREKVIGKMYTVRYQELTKNGIPRFPVGIAVRDYE